MVASVGSEDFRKCGSSIEGKDLSRTVRAGSRLSRQKTGLRVNLTLNSNLRGARCQCLLSGVGLDLYTIRT